MPDRTLLVHHLEPMWEGGYKRYGTSFIEQAEKVLEHVWASNYDRIIMTLFEDRGLGPAHAELGLVALCPSVYTYGYGWESDMDPGEGCRFVEGGAHSEVVLVEPWMDEMALEGDRVHLCGAFDGECIEDMEIALRAAGVWFERLEDLIV